MSKISLGQIDLLALQQYLEIVAGFRKKDDKAIDVTNVGTYFHPTSDNTDDPSEIEESPVKANQVAMAALDEFGLPIAYNDKDGVITIPARQTVLNSLMLDGIPASSYLLADQKDVILADTTQATYNMSEDIRNLKDELYQLKSQLIKTGSIKDPNVYNGFIDAFLGDNRNIISTGVEVETVSGNTAYVKSIGDLRIGDIVVFENNGEFNIQKIMNLNYNKFDVDLEWEGSTGPLAAHQGSIVKKSLGIGQGGKFVFGCIPQEGKVETEEMKFIVKDGIERIKVFELDHEGHGYGTEIKIPASLEDNVISKVKISLATKGMPGDLIGVFWKFDEELGSFKETSYKTRPIYATETSGWFNNFELDLLTAMPVVPGERYILILQTKYGSDNDKWFIGGFADIDCADDVHNDSYIVSNGLLYKSVEDKDMFLILTTKHLEETEIKKLSYGLYSCKFDVHKSMANRIRVELTVNKEGLYKVAENISTNYATGKITEIPLDQKLSKVFRNNVFDKDDLLVIGQEIGKVSSVGYNNSNVIPQEDMYVKPNADVYRVGYQVQVKVSNKVLDPTPTGVVERYENAEIYPLEFVKVIPGRDVIRPNESSDRLLFEADFYNQDDPESIKLLSFDHVEVQVVWHSNLDSNIIQTNTELEGAIFDIAVSVDQAYTTNPNK
jgi:hypothetical protein